MVTRILFDPRRDLPTGSTQSNPVTIEATPTGIREDGQIVVYPTTITFTITTGADILQLPANTASNGWRLTARDKVTSTILQTRTVRVPDQASIAYQTLPDIDPSSFEVTPGTARQWDATFWALVQAGAGGGLTDAGIAALIGVPTSAVAVALAATYLPFWKPNTAYVTGQRAVSPTGQTITANADFTSGATYVAGNWTVVAGGGGGTVSDATASAKGIVQLAGDLGGTASAPTVPGLAAKAPLASPTFSGTVAVPTAAAGTVSTQAASTAFVKAAIDALVAGAPGALDTLAEIATQLANDETAAAALTTMLNQRTMSAAPVTLSAAGTLTANVQNLLDATAGAFTATLPTPTRIGQLLVVERADAGLNLITIGGTIRGVTNVAPTLPGVGVAGESITFASESLTSWRPIASHKPKALLDKQFAAATVLTTAIKPVTRLGIFPDYTDSNSITTFQGVAGENATAVIVAYNFITQPDATVLTAHNAAGRTPLVTWMPNGASQAPVDNAAYKLSAIIAGNHDAYMTTFLTTIKNLGFPVMIRWGTEMNGDWNSWSEKVNGNSTGQFVLAWKHVIDLARSLGVTNVQWMWNPTTIFTSSIPLAGLYPGDSYVDLIGVDGYNWGAAGPGGLLSPSQLFDPTFAEIATVTTGKPLWIAEMGTQDTSGDKPAWIATFFTWLLAKHLAGFIWFNKIANEPGGNYDWRVNSSTAAANAFTAGMVKLRAANRATGAFTVAVADADTVYRGVQDFTGAKMVGVPVPTYTLPTPAQIGAQALITPTNYFTADQNLDGMYMATRRLFFDGTAAQTLTVLTNAAAPFPIGTEIPIGQSGTGQVTIAAASGVTLQSEGGRYKLTGRYAVASLLKVDTNLWWLYGNLST